jgi:hypothetical protein
VAVAPPSPPYLGPARNHGGSDNKPINRIVMHCTAGPSDEPDRGGARETAAYFRSTTRDASAHYVADPFESVQVVWDSVVAYQAPPNTHAIGYELRCSLSNEGRGHWQNDAHQAMLRVAAKDVARLCLAYNVPMAKLSPADLRAGGRGICGHIDVSNAWHETTHWDPGPFFPWTDFIRMVHDEADRLTSPQPVKPKPEPAPEPPAPPVPAKPPHDPFTVGLLPGRWDAPLKDWVRRWDEVRGTGSQIITLTECTKDSPVEPLIERIRAVGWETYHDPTPGPANIMHTWDPARFEQVGLPWKVKLTDIPILTKTGFEQPDAHSVGIALRDKQADKVILLVGAHLPLENTVRRRKAKEEALANLKDKAFDSGREQFPDSVRMFACDWNRRAHKQTVRDWFKATWPGLAASWATRAVRTQGPDWVAAGTRLVNLESVVLPRTKGDPLDHTTKVTRWGWR